MDHLRLTIGVDGHVVDVAVRVDADDVTVAELAMRASGRTVPVLSAGPRSLDPDAPLAAACLRPGAVLRSGPPVADEGLGQGLAVCVIAGIDAGRAVSLADGEVRVGRSPENDLRLASDGVSRRHCRIRLRAGSGLEVTDAGSVNGTVAGSRLLAAADGWVPLSAGELIRCGPTALVVRAIPVPDAPRAVEHLLTTAPTGPVPFFRPPSDLVLPDDAPIEVPTPPGPRRRPTMSVLSLLLPLGFGGAMVVITGQWLFALFILVMPALMIGQYLAARRRSKRTGGRSRARWQRDLALLRDELAEARAAEVRRLRATYPDAVEVVRWAEVLGERTWARRPGHPQHLEVALGLADLPWRPKLATGGAPPASAVDDLLKEVGTLIDVPLATPLKPGHCVGIAGERAGAIALAAGLVVQAATLHGPSDLRIAVLAGLDNVADWEWTKWLPHTSPSIPGGPSLLVTGTPSAAALEDLLADAGADAVLLLVLDAEDRPHVIDVAVRVLLRDHLTRTVGIAVAATADGLPGVCDPVIEMASPLGEATCRWPSEGGRTTACTAIGVDHGTAERCARSLARVVDPDVGGGGGSLPPLVAVAEVLGLRSGAQGAVAERWAAAVGLPVTLGIEGDGPLVVNLLVDGPSLAVVGARGSGKTELLTAAVLSLAAAVPPEAASFVLWGGSLRAVAALPHVATASTADDDEGATRLIEALDRELARRERLATPASPLVLVVDDVDTLARAAPQAVDGLVRSVRRGRAVGLHLLCATSRLGGQALSDLFDLAAIRVALRTATPVESNDAIGTDRAALIDRGVPGRGYAVVRRGEARPFQAPAATVGVPKVDGRLDVEPFTFASARGEGRVTARRPPDVQSVVAMVVDAGAGHARPFDLLRDRSAAEGATVSPDLPSLLGIGDIATFDPARTWQRGVGADLLRVPIGVDLDGRPVVLDLKESALDGMGPHGLLVGATGSGKSELLRTLVTGLAITHHPDALAMVLVDFKGGANFAALGELPHVAGLITNLASDLALVDRVLAALHGEQRRRQELLASAGNLASIREHRAARAAGAELDPLPELLIVVDEFAELLEQQPEFIDFFLTIGRVGRSLGIHLLLASQRLEEGRLRGLDTYLSYRLGLRTFSAIESRTVLGVTDAYALPPAPGGGYLKVGTDLFERFQAACVTVPIHSGGDGLEPGPNAPTVVSVAADRLVGAAPSAHQIWLPPLLPAIALNDVLGTFAISAERGFLAPSWPGSGRLIIPAGVLDEPELQRQRPLVLDLAGAHANLAVVGAPQTGKSTLLRTILLALLVTHTPDEVQVYAADHGGGTLDSLADAPHVGCVATRQEPERIRRLVAHVEAVLNGRERLFRERGIDSVATFRSRRMDGTLGDGPHADVFLVIDGWGAFRSEFDGLEPVIADLAARGLGYGVHVLLAANRWTEIRSNVLESLAGRLELKLGNPSESEMDRRQAGTIRPDASGRGLIGSRHFFQAALPRLDGERSVEHLHAATKVAVEHLAAPWTGTVAPPVLLLPTRVDPTDLPPPSSDGPAGVPIGISEAGLEPCWVDLMGADPHLLVFGDSESGKTTFLRALCRGLTARSSPDEVRLLVIDYRRTLLDVVEHDHLFGYGASEPAARTHVASLRALLDDRLPAADVTPAQLRDRSWWSGPEIVVVVDDYDMVVGPLGGPLSPLVDLIAQGRDVGLHLVLAHRVSGASKALYEQVLGRVREVSGAGLILSGDRDEGPLVGGVRAGEQVPGRGVLVRRRLAPLLVQVVDAAPV